MNCDDKFEQPRAIADPRMKITLNDGGLSFKRQDMNWVTARECAARVAMHLRRVEMYEVDMELSKEYVTVGKMMDMQMLDLEGEDQTICLAHHVGSGAIQVSITNMTMFQATIVCESVAFECNKALGIGAPLDHGATI